jgi:hypothetical protein
MSAEVDPPIPEDLREDFECWDAGVIPDGKNVPREVTALIKRIARLKAKLAIYGANETTD